MDAPLMAAGQGRHASRWRLAVAAATVAACVASIALLAPAARRAVVLAGDGVVPVGQLPFAKGEAAHFHAAKQMDDVKARSAMSNYFDELGAAYQSEHRANLRRYATTQALTHWFDRQGREVRQKAAAEKAARQARHPGQLHPDAQLQMMRGVHRATAEDPDDVPLERQESTADKMIKTVAEYQRKQQAHRDATLAQDNAAEEKMNRAVAEYQRKQQAQRNARLAKDNAAMAREKAAVADYTSKHRLTKAKKTAKAAGAHKQDASVAAAAQRKEHRKNTKARGVEAAPAEAATPMMAGGAGEKVKIDFYMESMCPGCKYYTKAVLRDLLTKPEFVSMVDFKVVPYGNGRMTGESIQCQHGDDECKGNTILACMQDMYPLSAESTGFVPTFVCMEAENGKPLDDFKKCAKQSEGVVDAAAVLSCANGPKGKQLALAAAKETEELNPPHEYAPWVTMNGQPLRDDAYELQKQVCAAYNAGGAGTSGLCSPAALTMASNRDRAMLHAQPGAGFSKCPNDAPDTKYYY